MSPAAATSVTPSAVVSTIIYSRKIVIRAVDYEYQSWPGYASNGISPSVFTFGVAVDCFSH